MQDIPGQKPNLNMAQAWYSACRLCSCTTATCCCQSVTRVLHCWVKPSAPLGLAMRLSPRLFQRYALLKHPACHEPAQGHQSPCPKTVWNNAHEHLQVHSKSVALCICLQYNIALMLCTISRFILCSRLTLSSRLIVCLSLTTSSSYVRRCDDRTKYCADVLPCDLHSPSAHPVYCR